MTKSVTVSVQVNITVDVSDGTPSGYVETKVIDLLNSTFHGSTYIDSANSMDVTRTRMLGSAHTQSLPYGFGPSTPMIASVTFDDVVRQWNEHWRYVNKRNSDWDMMSGYISVSESFVPGMSAIFPKVEREEVYPMWRSYSRALLDDYEASKILNFRKALCEHFDGMREDGLRDSTPVKMQPEEELYL